MYGLLENQMVFHQFSLKMLFPLSAILLLLFFVYLMADFLPPVWRKAFITAIHRKVESSLPSILIGQFH